MSYQLIAPSDYTQEHKQLIHNCKKLTSIVSAETDLFFGFKDINSRFISATDFAACLCGLKKGEDMIGMLDCELPCEGVVKFANDFVREDQTLLNNKDTNANLTILDVIDYCGGRKSLLSNKSLLKHDDSQSKLGVRFSAMKVELNDFLGLRPNYYAEFGTGRSISRARQNITLEDTQLTQFEHEICFLLTLGWSHSQIAEFMNKYHPTPLHRATDTIQECISNVREKLALHNCDDDSLVELLVHFGVHKSMPPAFFDRMVGTHVLH